MTYETFRLYKRREFYMNETYYIVMICVSFFRFEYDIAKDIIKNRKPPQIKMSDFHLLSYIIIRKRF